jgi:hypothetical protein
MGINPYSVESLWKAYKQGLGEINISKIDLLGEPIDDVKRKFRYPLLLRQNITGAVRTIFKTYL